MKVSIALVAILVGPHVQAQTFIRDSRSYSAPQAVTEASGDDRTEVPRGLLTVPVNHGQNGSVLLWEYKPTPASTPKLAIIGLPFHRLGWIIRIENHRYLACGLKYVTWSPVTTKGVLCLLELVEPTGTGQPVIHLRNSVEYDSIDPFDVSWSRSAVLFHLLDHANRRILTCSWAGWSPTYALPAQSSFETSADASLISELQAPLTVELQHELSGLSQDDEEELPAASPDIEPENPLVLTIRSRERDVWLYKHTGTWKAIDAQDGRFDLGTYLFQVPNDDNGFAVGGFSTIKVDKIGLGSGGFSLIENATGTVIATGDVANPGVPVSIGPFPAFNSNPCVYYRVVPTSITTTDSNIRFLSSVRHGLSQTDDYLAVSSGLMHGEGPSTVDPLFGVGVLLKPGSQAGSSQGTILGQLWINIRDADGSDPVVVTGDDATLNPVIVIDFSFPADASPPSIGHHLPIDDPSIGGTVALFQYAFLTPQGLVKSDVFGQLIVAAPASASATSSTPGPESVQKARRMFGADEQGRRTAASSQSLAKFLLRAGKR